MATEGAGIARSVYRLGYGLDGWVRFPAGATDFSLLHSVLTGHEAHPASYPMGTGDSFSGSKATGT
jgi:hypothetical protein